MLASAANTVAFLAFALVGGWVLLWGFQQSSGEPASPWRKLVGTALVFGATGLVLRGPAGLGAPGVESMDAFLIVGTAAACGLLLAIIWGSSLGAWVARPLSGLFDDGGLEWKRAPLYSIAESRIKQGRVDEAEQEIRRQLEEFPGDLRGTLLLAELQVASRRDLPGAVRILEEYVLDPRRRPGDAAAALSRLADWHLKYAHDVAAARSALERIRQLVPESETAFLAGQRMAHLPAPGLLEEREAPRAIPLAEYEPRVGLLPRGALLPAPERPTAEIEAEYLRRLEECPEDNEARENLASLYATGLGRADLAAEQLEQLIAQPHAPARLVVHWLNLLADARVRGGDVDSAQQALGRIEQRFPKTVHAANASHRRMHLNLEMRGLKEAGLLKLGPPARPAAPEG